MASGNNYLAIDLGAESGRVIAITLNGNRIALKEVHRFENKPVRLPDGLYWDVLRLWTEIKEGIAAAVKSGMMLDGIGLDTWGVDYALLDRAGALLGNPFHYRDARTDGILVETFKRLPREEIYKHTGIQIMQINTVYQLFSMALKNSPLFDVAQVLVTIPDLFNFWLSGEITCEFTNATTTQCYDPRNQDWAWQVLEALGIPKYIFHEITQPGTVLGPLLPVVAEEIGTGGVPVIAPACHDTGSAVVAVPAEKKNFAWISSGTWSILGVEVSQPIISSQTLKYNFTNEGGVCGTWRLSKNVMGLWLVQECKRSWEACGEQLSYTEITHLAREARPFLAVVDPDDNSFLQPGDMPARIQAYCNRTSQPVPQSKGEIIRVALESIALKYRWVLNHLEEIIGAKLEPVHIIGGGIQNCLLNQFTADATGRIVVTGPVEATAIGNGLMQALALGQLDSLDDAREVVRHSFVLDLYAPTSQQGWDEAYVRMVKVLGEG